jgi:hypothetical protein
VKTAREILMKAQPDPALVRKALDQNDARLLGIIQALTTGVRTAIDNNGYRMVEVQDRLRNSVVGHIKRNVQLLKPVAQKLADAVHNNIDSVQAQVNLVAARPEVQQWLQDGGWQEAFAGAVSKPLTSGQKGSDGEKSAGTVDAREALRDMTPYELWYHCQQQQAVGVPSSTEIDTALMQAQGWMRLPSPHIYFAHNQQQVQDYLLSRKDEILRLCRGNREL